MQLVIGNKNYSSWSLRAWLYMRESGIAFEEIRIPLYGDDSAERIARFTPAGRVPVLLDGELAVWDSLAIMEHLRMRSPGAVGWPAGISARARAWSVVAEMHSGFLALRQELPQNLRAVSSVALDELSPAARSQVDRVFEIWNDCRGRHGGSGKWLFGDFSIADVVYAPVALRFLTYRIPLPDVARPYVDAVAGLESVEEWMADAELEPETLDFIDQRRPSDATPLSFG